ncbi:class I SAM-dependent RNA methyltransferase [Anderseniella sp. Alg231-50]|uniref:class I SAM-dependent RNA methyltransferase n=1 Tax=Anderseniella sp. Alg231-50 TaxID=1922226 RepID=UPI00307B3914
MADLTIEAMGARGEGIARGDGAPVYVPYALPGERVRADVKGDRGRLADVVGASPDRVSPECAHFGSCGGCLLQHWSQLPYAQWKRQLVVEALSRKGLTEIEVAPLVDAHGAGRRRVTLTVARGKAGFSAHRSHDHVPVITCPVLVPQLAQAPKIATALVQALGLKKPQRVYLLASDTGLDCELVGVDDPELDARVRIADIAEEYGLARVTASGDMLIERGRPALDVDGATVTPPPGGFAQATAAGEQALASIVVPALAGHAVVADLFCGWGAFGLRLAKASRVLAVDSDKPAIAALETAARGATGLKPLVARTHDLMRDPLTAPELKGITGAVFDPPRAGAGAQAAELAAAGNIQKVVGVSCDAATFARDASVLVQGGFTLERVVPVDQFRYSAHVEMVGIFSR